MTICPATSTRTCLLQLRPVLRTLVGRTVRAVWEDAFPVSSPPVTGQPRDGDARDAEQRGKLPQREVGPPVRGDHEDPVLQRQAPRSTLVHRICALAPRRGDHSRHRDGPHLDPAVGIPGPPTGGGESPYSPQVTRIATSASPPAVKMRQTSSRPLVAAGNAATGFVAARATVDFSAVVPNRDVPMITFSALDAWADTASPPHTRVPAKALSAGSSSPSPPQPVAARPNKPVTAAARSPTRTGLRLITIRILTCPRPPTSTRLRAVALLFRPVIAHPVAQQHRSCLEPLPFR